MSYLQVDVGMHALAVARNNGCGQERDVVPCIALAGDPEFTALVARKLLQESETMHYADERLSAPGSCGNSGVTCNFHQAIRGGIPACVFAGSIPQEENMSIVCGLVITRDIVVFGRVAVAKADASRALWERSTRLRRRSIRKQK